MRVVIVSTTLVISAACLAAEVHVPALDVEKSCRSVGSLAVGQVSPQKCIEQEMSARTELQKSWSTFGAGDRERCTALTVAAGNPSYIELLSCVQMERDARELEQQYRKETGQKCPEPLSCQPRN
jgi:hypothetical protein